MKVAHLSVPKSGSNILRAAMGWAGKQRVTDGSEKKQLQTLKAQLESDDGDVNGHVRYSEVIHEMLKDHFIIFQYRDPRDVIVSWYHWWTKLGKNPTWKDIIHNASRQMELMEPWYEHGDLMVRYEYLIEKDYPPTHTFREGGGVGSWKTDFPQELWNYYHHRCMKVRYWEFDS